jgi:hypothetical protein
MWILLFEIGTGCKAEGQVMVKDFWLLIREPQLILEEICLLSLELSRLL